MHIILNKSIRYLFVMTSADFRRIFNQNCFKILINKFHKINDLSLTYNCWDWKRLKIDWLYYWLLLIFI